MKFPSLSSYCSILGTRVYLSVHAGVRSNPNLIGRGQGAREQGGGQREKGVRAADADVPKYASTLRWSSSLSH